MHVEKSTYYTGAFSWPGLTDDWTLSDKTLFGLPVYFGKVTSGRMSSTLLDAMTGIMVQNIENDTALIETLVVGLKALQKHLPQRTQKAAACQIYELETDLNSYPRVCVYVSCDSKEQPVILLV